MKEKVGQKGFTILEVLVSLFIFSLFMGGFWQFYAVTYQGHIKFNNEVDLAEQARLVVSFIREEIRLSDEVTIVVEVKQEDGNVVEQEIHPPDDSQSPQSRELIEGKLIAIWLNTNANTKKAKRKIEFESKSRRLYYEANLTESLIADRVDNIKVIRQEDSRFVQFECVLGNVQNDFSESLEYKTKYNIP